MTINRNNYEAYFLDYLEHRLDDNSIRELFTFLNNHEDLKAELRSYDPYVIEKSNEIFLDKESLKKLDFSVKEVNSFNFNDFCIAFHENILDQAGIDKLNYYLHLHPNKRIDFELFGKVYFQPDNSITTEKVSLLKNSKPLFIIKKSVFIRWTSVAAVFILGCFIYLKWDTTTTIKTLVVPKESRIVASYIKDKSGAKINIKTIAIKNSQNSINPKVNHENLLSDSVIREPAGLTIAAIHLNHLENNYNLPGNLTFKRLKHLPDYNDLEDSNLDVIEYAQSTIQKKIDKVQKIAGMDDNISIWNIAQITLKGYNKLAENKLNLSRKVDENGNVVALSLQSEEGTIKLKIKSDKN